MTKRSIFIQIFSEATGLSKKIVSEHFKDFEKSMPPIQALDLELSEKEAQKLIKGLRQEKADILQWLEKGYHKALDKRMWV